MKLRKRRTFDPLINNAAGVFNQNQKNVQGAAVQA
jgi:hypothetical protein